MVLTPGLSLLVLIFKSPFYSSFGKSHGLCTFAQRQRRPLCAHGFWAGGGSRIACDPHGFPCGHAVIDSLITGLLTIPLPSGGTVVHSCFGRPPVCSTLPFLPL